MRQESQISAGLGGIGWAIAVGVVLGICIGGWYWYKHRKPIEGSLFCFSDLIANQIVMGVVNGRVLTLCFRENASAAKGTPAFFLAKPCQQTVEMFGLDAIPEELDLEHNLLQIVVDEREKLPVAARMVSFENMDPDLEKAFNGKNFLLIKSDT